MAAIRKLGKNARAVPIGFAIAAMGRSHCS